MKRIVIGIITLLLFVVNVFAQLEVASADKLLIQANEKYKAGQFSDAAKLYEEVTKSGVSAKLYYNLGNSYYKANEIGKAVLNYERALRLDPTYADAKYNLEIAESKIVDNINSSSTFFLRNWLNNLIASLSSNQWMFTALFFFILMLGAFLVFVFSRVKKRRKISFYSMLALLTLMIVTLIFSGINKKRFIKHDDAVITVGVVVVKSSPDETGTEIFQLHEGTRVKVKSQLGEWSEITVDNAAVGWVKEEVMERI